MQAAEPLFRGMSFPWSRARLRGTRLAARLVRSKGMTKKSQKRGLTASGVAVAMPSRMPVMTAIDSIVADKYYYLIGKTIFYLDIYIFLM